MKFNLNQQVFIIVVGDNGKEIASGNIKKYNTLTGIYEVELNSIYLRKRGSEAIFSTEPEAQKYLETLKT